MAKEVKLIEVDKKTGKTIYNLAASALNSDWLRSARLLRKAKAGDKEAEAELEKLDNAKMLELD